MEEYVAKKKYYVFDKKHDPAKAIKEVGTLKHISFADFTTVKGYVKGDDLYFEKVKGAKEVLVVTRKEKK